jgi:hypothetical protein
MVASIQFIKRIIETYAQAAEVNLSAPGRQNSIVVVTPELADEVMITGDLHGNRRNFNLIRRIADLAGHPRRQLILQEVCHGGPVYPQNGGCMSHAMLEDVAGLIVQFPGRVHFILGNHELAELTEYPIQKNKQMLNLMFRLGLQHVYGPATEKVREAYLPFLESCPLAVRLPGGVFVSHSVPEKADSDRFDPTIFTRQPGPLEFFDRSSIFDLVWGRDYRPQNARAFAEKVGARVLINGHEPCSEGYSVPNDTQIILDCCGDQARYVMLPTRGEWTQAGIVERIEKLG